MARRSYALTKWRLVRRMSKSTGTPIVVVSMAKTASSAVVRAVRDAGVPNPVFKVHLLDRGALERAEARYRRSDRSARPRHIFQSTYLTRNLPTPERPWLVVSVVRDPVARSVSEFFQSGARLDRISDVETTTALAEEWIARQGIPHTLTWFDREFRDNVGVDVFDHPFDPAQGYTVIEAPSARVLLLRQENLALDALRSFIAADGAVDVVPENVGGEKEYSSLYADVVRNVQFSAATLDKAYDSRFCRHFYSPTERAELRRDWERV